MKKIVLWIKTTITILLIILLFTNPSPKDFEHSGSNGYKIKNGGYIYSVLISRSRLNNYFIFSKYLCQVRSMNPKEVNIDYYYLGIFGNFYLLEKHSISSRINNYSDIFETFKY